MTSNEIYEVHISFTDVDRSLI